MRYLKPHYYDKFVCTAGDCPDSCCAGWQNPGARPYMATTKTTQVYTDVHYDPDCYIMFGPESRGIPEELLIEDPERCVRIPMWGETRSLNLSNSVAIILYEALRQNGFEKMNTEGHLHHLQWK